MLFCWLGPVPGFVTAAVRDGADGRLRLAPDQPWRATQTPGQAGKLDGRELAASPKDMPGVSGPKAGPE